MVDAAAHQQGTLPGHAWPAGISRMPYWLYRDSEILRAEQ